MSIQRQAPNSGRRGSVSFSALVELVRHRRQRSRNRAELMTLDVVRLRDIGLNEEARAQILYGK